MKVHDRGNTNFIDNVPRKTNDTSDFLYRLIFDAAIDQDRIGFYPFFEGHMSKKWSLAQEVAYRKQQQCRRTGQTWAKKTIQLIYAVIRSMWKNQNDTFFNNQQNGLSYKRRKGILRAVETQLKIGFHLLRPKDKQTVCTRYGTLKNWTTQMLEAWLKNVTILRERSSYTKSDPITDESHAERDEIYIERSENLKQFSILKFHCWRMKYHHKTAIQYVHPTEEMTCHHKQQRFQ